MQNDSNTNLQSLKEIFLKFRADRDWEKFHDPKNLAEAISIEASELQEHFLWKEKEQIAELLKTDEKFRRDVGEELADVISYCINFANSADLDITTIVLDKVEKNAVKYPVDKSKGIAVKYDKL